MSRRQPASFQELDATHGELEDLFLAHQEQIIAGHFRAAAILLQCYRSRLVLHMKQEEERLLPLYAAHLDGRAGDRTSPATVYVAEHRKVRGLLERVERDFGALQRPQPARLHVIALLEREAQIKRVIEHHSERERQHLYAVLDRVTSRDEREYLIAQCLADWRAGSVTVDLDPGPMHHGSRSDAAG